MMQTQEAKGQELRLRSRLTRNSLDWSDIYAEITADGLNLDHTTESSLLCDNTRQGSRSRLHTVTRTTSTFYTYQEDIYQYNNSALYYARCFCKKAYAPPSSEPIHTVNRHRKFTTKDTNLLCLYTILYYKTETNISKYFYTELQDIYFEENNRFSTFSTSAS